jgi:DNA-binding transcriptional LysR family regulator
MTPTQARAFLAVAIEGSFTGAAKRLNVSQPSVTTQVGSIERQYEVELFHRIGRGVRIKDANNRRTIGRSVVAAGGLRITAFESFLGSPRSSQNRGKRRGAPARLLPSMRFADLLDSRRWRAQELFHSCRDDTPARSACSEDADLVTFAATLAHRYRLHTHNRQTVGPHTRRLLRISRG